MRSLTFTASGPGPTDGQAELFCTACIIITCIFVCVGGLSYPVLTQLHHATDMGVLIMLQSPQCLVKWQLEPPRKQKNNFSSDLVPTSVNKLATVTLYTGDSSLTSSERTCTTTHVRQVLHQNSAPP